MAGQKLPGPLLLKVRETLRVIYNEDTFEDLLLSIDRRFDDYAPSSQLYPKRVEKTIESAHAGGWLVDLIAKARSGLPADPNLVQIEIDLRAIVVVTAPNANQFQTCCLSGGHVMVDRAPLRAALEKLYYPKEPRILVVNDAAPVVDAARRVQTGKSHSRRLIAHLHQERQDFGLIEVDLESIRDALKPPKLVWPVDVAESIVSQMGVSSKVLPKPPRDGQWSRWNLAFCDRFVGQVKRDRRWWIVVDSFNVVLVPQETQDLFKELATRINGTLGGMRMILLGYSGTFHPSVLPTVKEDALRVFGETELTEFFARAFAEKNRAFTDDDVADSVIRVLSGADPTQPDFLAKAASLVLAELP